MAALNCAAFFSSSPVLLLASEARPQSSTVNVDRQSFKALGAVNAGGSDLEMDTDKGDVVSLGFTATIKIDESKNAVVLWLDYTCQEYRGNETKLRMTRAITLYQPPNGWRLASLKTSGNSGTASTVETYKCRGDSHDFYPFASLPESFFDEILFRMDSASGNDAPHVGVKGLLSYTVTIEQK